MTEEADSPPEAPELVAQGRWLYYQFRMSKAELLRFWWAVALIAVCVWFGTRWYYKDAAKDETDRLGGIISSDAATIRQLTAERDLLADELKGTSPKLAAIQAGRDKVRAELQRFYVEGGKLFNRPKIDGDEQLMKYEAEVNAWSQSLDQWVAENMGEPAEARVFDPGKGTGLVWFGISEKQGKIRDFITNIRENLTTLIETAAWDGEPVRRETSKTQNEK